MYADSSDEDDACSVLSEDKEEEEDNENISESGDDDDDESDLLLPYNPRSSPPGARASPVSRENIDRNASDSGAAATGSKKIPVKKTSPTKKKASVPVPVLPITTTNNNQPSSSQKKKKTAPKTKRPSAATLALLLLKQKRILAMSIHKGKSLGARLRAPLPFLCTKTWI
jgi:hypothetical protein